MKNKVYDIRERTFNFAIRVLELTGKLPNTPEAKIVRYQLAAAGTSIGSNTEEADGAITKPDKRKSLVIARKEARETRYWLRIVNRKWGNFINVSPEIQEVSELLLIISSIVAKLK